MSRIEELEKRLAADPNSRIFVQLAEEYRKAGLLEQAIEVCEEGLKKHPHYPSARVALGRALLEDASYDRASQEFESVLRAVPDNILANKFLGETYHRLGRLDDALEKYQVAQTLAPEDLEIGEKIEAVRAELASGAAEPPPTAPPVPESPPAEPPMPAPPEPPVAEVAEASYAESPFAPADEPEEAAPEEFGAKPEEEDLPPIPLVDVDEPMVLEERYFVPGSSAEEESSTTETPSAGVPPPSPEPPESTESAPFEPELFAPEAAPPPPPKPASPPPEPAREATPAPPNARAETGGTEAPASSGMETPTMAEIYASQGHFDRAIAVYENLLARNPEAAHYRERVEELSMLRAAAEEGGASPPAAEGRAGRSGDEMSLPARQKAVEVLEGWLEAIRRSKES